MKVMLIHKATKGIFDLREIPNDCDVITVPDDSLVEPVRGYPDILQGRIVAVASNGYENIGGGQVPVFEVVTG